MDENRTEALAGHWSTSAGTTHTAQGYEGLGNLLGNTQEEQ